MEAVRVIDTQESQVLVVQPGQAKLEDVERFLILATLRRTRYNRTKTARLLGIGIRTLQRKLKQYGEVEASAQSATPAVVMAV
jgi:DNA-binding NtrC family response regulator